jgi:Na+/proline symporter
VIASVFFNIAYIVAQVLAGGILLTVLTGGTVPFNIGMVIVAAIVMLHVTVTGIRGIAYLDTVNGAVIITLLGAFGIFIALDAGGLANVFGGLSRSLGPAAGSHYSIPGTVGAFSAEVVVLFGILFTLGTAFASPATWIRMYALDKERNFAKIAAGMLLAMIVAHVWGTNLIGTYGHTLFPFAGPGQPGTNPDFVSSLAAFEALPFAVAVLFLVAVFAAVVSTTDSYMHVMSATVVRDFYKAVVNPDMDEQSELQANYVVMALTAVAGLVGAFLYPGLITPLAIVAGGFTIQLLPLLIGAVAWPRASTEAAIAAPAVGTVLLVVFQLGLIPNPFPVPNVPGLVVSFLANVAVFVGVSYLTRPVSMERIEQFHGTIARNFSTDRVETDAGPGPAPADD